MYHSDKRAANGGNDAEQANPMRQIRIRPIAGGSGLGPQFDYDSTPEVRLGSGRNSI